MLRIFTSRLHQGHRTLDYPRTVPALPDRFRGRPILDPARCPAECAACADACPTGAISFGPGGAGVPSPRLDLGRCLFCTECSSACPEGTLTFTPDHRLATRTREALVVDSAPDPTAPPGTPSPLALARALDAASLRLFGRSLKLRQVSAGGCNACEADVNVLSTVVFDLGRFGIQFVASPRHADGLLITGPVTANMSLALRKTWEAVPEPRLVVAVGACAISGGPYVDHPEQSNGASSHVPVDLYVPGCPPHPLTILDGLLRLLGRLDAA